LIQGTILVLVLEFSYHESLHCRMSCHPVAVEPVAGRLLFSIRCSNSRTELTFPGHLTCPPGHNMDRFAQPLPLCSRWSPPP